MPETPGEILARQLQGKAGPDDQEKFIQASKKALGPACTSFKVELCTPAYKDGFAAAVPLNSTGVTGSKDKNPNPRDSQEYKDWNSGWEHAMEIDKKLADSCNIEVEQITQARCDGRTAAEVAIRHDRISKNPYPCDSQERIDWNLGWQEGSLENS